jgi:hypothetical protein
MTETKYQAREKTVRATGIIVTGTARLCLWGGGEGSVQMEPRFLPFEHSSEDNILRCVNDNGFGCESVKSAEVKVSLLFDDGSVDPEGEISAGPERAALFNGWRHLQEIGVNTEIPGYAAL